MPLTCQRRKAVLKGRAPLAATPLATQLFKRVSVDLVELPPAWSRDRYVMTVVDELTRFVQLVPLLSKDDHIIADALISNFMTLFGPPDLYPITGQNLLVSISGRYATSLVRKPGIPSLITRRLMIW